MIWLADENVPVRAIQRLREGGIDLASIREIEPGLSDTAVLRRAHQDGRGLITFDRDFGELIFLQRCDCPPSVVYLTFIPSYPEQPAEVLLALLVGHAGSSVTMEHSQKCRSKAGKCRNSHPISNLPNAALALLAKRSVTELSAWPTRQPRNS